jgi:hypothetical protein
MNLENISVPGGQRAGATAQQLAAVVQQLLPELMPDILSELLKLTDGFLTPGGISVYGTQDIIERNTTFEVPEYCAGYLLIGDNSGGKGYLMKLDPVDSTVFSSGLGDLQPSRFVEESSHFESWVGSLR